MKSLRQACEEFIQKPINENIKNPSAYVTKIARDEIKRAQSTPSSGAPEVTGDCEGKHDVLEANPQPGMWLEPPSIVVTENAGSYQDVAEYFGLARGDEATEVAWDEAEWEYNEGCGEGHDDDWPDEGNEEFNEEEGDEGHKEDDWPDGDQEEEYGEEDWDEGSWQ